MAWIKTFVDALNAIRSNVWSVLLIASGILLVMKGHSTEGGSLITGAFAVFRSSKDDTPPPTPPVPDPNAQ